MQGTEQTAMKTTKIKQAAEIHYEQIFLQDQLFILEIGGKLFRDRIVVSINEQYQYLKE